jgi:anti-sigma factor RsiW
MAEKDEREQLLDQAISRAYAGGAPPSFRAVIERFERTERAERAAASSLPPAQSAVTVPRRRPWTWAIPLAAALAVMGAFAMIPRARVQGHAQPSEMVREALNDHLRVLYSEHPVEIASGGIHQVKPWFAGKLEFAPVNPFAGDADFPLEGGSVAYFLDRKAATYVYKRNLHVVTLFVFQAEGLSWPAASDDIGSTRGTVTTTRGFHVLMWRRDDLGYALVSDLNQDELRQLARRIAP